MANIKSAKKRVLVNAKKNEQNKAIRSAVKTEIKKIDLLIKENKLEEAKACLSQAFSAIDSACSKNIFHTNNAARKKAKLAKKVDSALASVKVEEAPVKKAVKKVKAEVVEQAPAQEEPAKEPAEAPKKTTTRKPRAKKVEAAE